MKALWDSVKWLLLICLMGGIYVFTINLYKDDDVKDKENEIKQLQTSLAFYYGEKFAIDHFYLYANDRLTTFEYVTMRSNSISNIILKLNKD